MFSTLDRSGAARPAGSRCSSTPGSENRSAGMPCAPRTRKVADSPGSRVTSPWSTVAPGCSLSTRSVTSRSSTWAVTVTSVMPSPAVPPRSATSTRRGGRRQLAVPGLGREPQPPRAQAPRRRPAHPRGPRTPATSMPARRPSAKQRAATVTGIRAVASTVPSNPRRVSTTSPSHASSVSLPSDHPQAVAVRLQRHDPGREGVAQGEAERLLAAVAVDRRPTR